MNIENLHTYLASCKACVDSVKDTLGDALVVLGNEAADIDSVVSAIVLALYTAHSIAKEEKENKADGLQTLVFPVINCNRDDLFLRTEVIYLLKKHSINIENLICKNEIDIAGLQAGGKLKLTLVDHNVPAAADAYLQSSVVRVVDHHKRDKPLDRRDIIEPVGSCCTLVAEIVLGLFDKDPLICSLLYSTIIFDTVNLSPTAQRATPKDIQYVNELEDCLTKLTGVKPQRQAVYDPLLKARSDVSQLSAEQLLRKDAKLLKTPEITIFVPALPMLSQKFLDLPNAMEALKSSMKNNRCSAIVAMGWEISEQNSMRRDVAIYSDSIHKAKQVRTPLENCAELNLQLVRHATEAQGLVWVYEQKHVQFSRKFMLPFLATHFETKAQSQNELDALAGVDILMPEGEMSPNRVNVSYNSVPSISCTAAHSLGVGDPISHGGSSQSSAYNSCPYTPQNSCAEPEGLLNLEHYFLPSFNSREMIEKIEQKRGKLRGYDKLQGDHNSGTFSSYPFTPKNSYVEGNFESVFEVDQKEKHIHDKLYQGPGILNAIDTELLQRKVMEKRNDPSIQFNVGQSPGFTKFNEAVDSSGTKNSPPNRVSSGGSGNADTKFSGSNE